MEWQRIRKRPEDYTGANLQDYDAYAKQFAWPQARALLDGLPGGGLNIAYEAIDRHVLAGRGQKLAHRRSIWRPSILPGTCAKRSTLTPWIS